jgi:outer membrane protein assembly factor BamB
MKAAALAFCLLSTSVSVIAADWPTFRGPYGRGVADDSAVPVSWDTTSKQNVRWRTAIPGLSHASPIVWGDAVYVVSGVSPDSALDMKAEGVVFAKDLVRHEWRLHCLDLASGREQWNRVVHAAVPRQPRHVRGTYANATPATNGRYIAAVLGNEGLFVMDMKGTVVWRQEMAPADPEWMLDAASSPVIVDDVVVVQNDWRQAGFVAGYDLASGKQRWRTERSEGMSWSTPGVYEHAGTKRLVFNSSRWVRALDPRDGREIWRVNNEAKGAWDRVPTPFAAEGLVIVAGGGGDRPMFAVRPDAAGELMLPADRRANDAIVWITEKGSPYMPTPIVYRGLVYVCASNGVVSVYRARDGTPVYQARLGTGAGPFSASPVAADGRIYFASEGGDVFVVAAGETFELLSRNGMDAPCFATPALARGLIVIRTSNAVYGIGGA